MPGYLQLLPEGLVLLAALVALFGELLPGRDRTVALLAAALAALAAMLVAWGGTGDALFGGLLLADTPARFVRFAVAALTALWALWFSGRAVAGERGRELVALAMFSSAGGMLLALSADLITIYMAIELSTMPLYVMMGYRRGDIRGLEGALKYFLLSLLTSLIMLYGLSFLYGITGTTHLVDIAAALPGSGSIAMVGAVLALAGLFAKLSAAPFHYWAPDAYAGAPAASVAFVSTVPKIAGAAALVRLTAAMAPGVEQLWVVIAIGAVASMLLGNLAALPQTDLRRLMAYSGVAHSGYMLLGLAAGATYGAVTGAESGYLSVLLYAVAYAIPSMAIMMVVAEEGTEISSLAGLVARRPAVAWAMVIWLVSLIGIPPLAGFFGKLYLFGSALAAGGVWMTGAVVVAVLASVISAGYYFRFVRTMFFAEPEAAVAAVAPSRASAVAHVGAVAATVAIGLGAGFVLEWLGLVAG